MAKRGLTQTREGKSYSEKAKYWFRQLDRGIRRRQKEESRWTANESAEDMKQWYVDDEWREGEYDQPTVNKIGSYIRTYRAAIAFRNPRVKLKPKNAKGWEMVTLPVMGQDGQVATDEMGQVKVIQMTRAQARERLMNDIISKPHFGLRDTISRIVKSGCLGYGVAMVGYQPMFSTPLEQDVDDEVEILEDGTIDLDAFVLDSVTGGPAKDENGNYIKKNQIPIRDQWFIDWVHYRDMIIDPDGGNDFMKHRWVAMEQIRTLEEVKEDPLFSNTKDLEAIVDDLRPDDVSSKKSEDYDLEEDSEKLIRLFHIYDLVRNRRIVLADGHGEVLLDEVMPLGITHSPFAFFRPNERVRDDEEFYPRPLCTDMIPLAIEKNEARRYLHIARKRSVGKIITEKGVIDAPNRNKLTNDNHLEVVEIDKVSAYGLEKTLHPFAPPPIGGDLYNHLHIIDADFDEISGMGVASRGGSSGDSATETQKRSQYEGTRYDFDRQQLRDMLILLFKGLDDSIDANMTQPMAIAISGEAGLMQEVLMDRTLIECDCDVDIDLTEMMPTDDAGDAARMIQFAQVVGQNRWMAEDERVLRTMAERVKINDENFIRGLVEAAQKASMMEMMMLQAKSQPKVPEGEVPASDAQAAEQTAAGQQTPNMQGAS